MKIIFDNEEQKKILLRGLGTKANFCPSDFGFRDCDIVNYACSVTCEECFKNSGIEMEVSERK